MDWFDGLTVTQSFFWGPDRFELKKKRGKNPTHLIKNMGLSCFDSPNWSKFKEK